MRLLLSKADGREWTLLEQVVNFATQHNSC
jgi:hypothetical protein